MRRTKKSDGTTTITTLASLRKRELAVVAKPERVQFLVDKYREIKLLIKEYNAITTVIRKLVKAYESSAEFSALYQEIESMSSVMPDETHYKLTAGTLSKITTGVWSIVNHCELFEEEMEELFHIVNLQGRRRNNMITVKWDVPDKDRLRKSIVGPLGPRWYVTRMNQEVRYLMRIKPPTKRTVRKSYQGKYITKLLETTKKINDLAEKRKSMQTLFVSLHNYLNGISVTENSTRHYI